MSFYRIGDRGIIFGPGGPRSFDFASTGYGALSTGRLWLNLDYQKDWARNHLWIDEMRTAKAWRAGTSSAYNDTVLLAEMMATADADGYPTALPAGVQRAGANIMTEQGTEVAPVLAGRYRLDWVGSGTVAVVGGTNQTSGAGWIEFDFTPTAGNFVDVQILATTPGNHVRGMRCYMTAHAALLAAGKKVHPAFKAAWGNVGLLRWMQALDTNAATEVDWSDEPTPTSICQGPSITEMIDVCNELGMHCWLNIPHLASEGYVTALANLVKARLNPELKCYIEYANEWWNFAYGFVGAPYFAALAVGQPYGFNQIAGAYSARAMVWWSAVFAGEMHRTVRVAGIQTDYIGLETGFLLAPQYIAAHGGVVPHTVHDAIAATGYYFVPGGVTTWNAAIATATTDYAAGLAELRAAINTNIDTLEDSKYPHFRTVADTYGKDLIMYEGGTHVFVPPGVSNQTLANQLVTDLNTGQDGYDFSARVMGIWDAIADGPYHHFVSTQKYVAAGSFGAQHYINDFTQPRYTALMEYNVGDLPVAETTLTPLPLNQRLVITGHSIPDAIAKGPLQGAITSMGGTSAIFGSTGPAASALFRWTNDPASPVAVKAAMEAPGASYDAFMGIEGYGGSYEEGRKSVREHITWSSGHAQAVLWHNLAASAGCTRSYYANFWRDGVPNATPVFNAAWRSAQELEKPYWNALIDYVNANKGVGTPTMQLVPWLEVFCSVYDAIQAGTVTGVTMADFFADHVHPETNVGRWVQIATTMLVVYQRHPDTLPAAAATNATISEPLAAQLRPIVWSTCLALPRTGLSA